MTTGPTTTATATEKAPTPVTKKTPKKKATSGKKPSKLQFSAEDTQRVLDLLAEEHCLENEVLDLKGQRDEARQARNAAQADLDELLNQQDQARKASDRQFRMDAEASAKVIELFKTQKEHQDTYDGLSENISELNDRVRAIPEDIKKIAAGIDPRGTLWEAFGLDNPDDQSKEADSDGD